MKNRDLDNIYRKGLQNKEVAPPAGMWERIASSLPEEKPKAKAYPMWFPLVGAAAVLLLLFNIGLLFFPTHSGTEPAQGITNQEESTKESSNPDSFITTEQFNKTINSIVGEFENRLLEANNSIDSLMEVTNAHREQFPPVNIESGVAETSNRNSGGSQPIDNKTEDLNNSPLKDQTQEDSIEIVQNAPPKEQGMENTPATHFKEQFVEQTSVSDKPIENTLEEQIAFEEFHNAELSKDETSKNRFSISTRVAPIFFDTGGGNVFDTQFSQNKASGEVSFAYGVNIAYRVSDRIKLRSGLNKIEMGYNTQEVPYNAAVNSPALNASSKIATMSSPAPGVLNQHLGFFELPLEMEYLLIDRRIGLSLLVGGSSLFLDQNNLSLNTSVFSEDLGQANNLNTTSFTTNFGVGFNYKLTDQFNFNLEPVIKYQLNTFKNTDGNPYFFGLYTGFSFDF